MVGNESGSTQGADLINRAFDLSFLFNLLSNRLISCRRRILEGLPVYRTGHTIASGGGSVRACPAQTQNVTQARIEGDGSLETCIQAQK